MKNAVKTNERAIEILQQWILDQNQFNSDSTIDTTETTCECGDTTAFRAVIEGFEKIAVVAVCECCGDDDNFISDVINVK